MTTTPDLDGHLNSKGFAGRRLSLMPDIGGGSDAVFHNWNAGGTFHRLWFARGHHGEGKDFTLPGHADLQNFHISHQTSEEGFNAFRKDEGRSSLDMLNFGNQSLLGYYSSRDKHASTRPFVPVKSVWDERIIFENGIYNLTQTLPPYTSSSYWQDSTSSNHVFGTFDQEHGSSSNVEAQCTLNLAQFESFKVTHPSSVSEEQMHRSEDEPKLDVTLSLSLPDWRKPVDSKQALGSLALGTSGRPKSEQLTIFYGGNVNVYDNVPAEKAKSIMQWAGGGSEYPWNPSSLPPAANRPSSPLHPPLVPSPLSSVPCGPRKHEDLAKPNNNSLPTCSSVHKVLPQARKASLARFLEKRKERVGTKNPYARKNIPEQTMSHGDTELSTNCGAICPVMGGSAESDDGKMDHTSREDGNWIHLLTSHNLHV